MCVWGGGLSEYEALPTVCQCRACITIFNILFSVGGILSFLNIESGSKESEMDDEISRRHNGKNVTEQLC
jgi:hypothetical protein